MSDELEQLRTEVRLLRGDLMVVANRLLDQQKVANQLMDVLFPEAGRSRFLECIGGAISDVAGSEGVFGQALQRRLEETYSHLLAHPYSDLLLEEFDATRAKLCTANNPEQQ